MKASSWSVLAALAVALSGCVSPAEQKAMDTRQCEGYGFAQGTDAFANCMMTTANRRADQQRKWDEERMKNFKASQQTQAAPSVPAEPTHMDCTTSETTTTAGNTTNVHSTTNCRSR